MKSLKSRSCGPISSTPSLFSKTDSSACVPQAFCMVWEAKNMFSAASKSKVPSLGLSVGFSPVGYLNRNIMPYTGLNSCESSGLADAPVTGRHVPLLLQVLGI